MLCLREETRVSVSNLVSTDAATAALAFKRNKFTATDAGWFLEDGVAVRSSTESKTFIRGMIVG
jgi:hypothetical protein